MSSKRMQAMFYYEDVKPEPEKSRFPFINYFRQRFNIGKFNPEEKRKAVVQKSGHYRVKYSGLKQYRGKFLQDLYITLIDLQWRYALAILFNVYLVTYFFFAIMWYWMMYNHGDLEHFGDSKWETCVRGVNSFADAMLFSIETQTTIGYGFAYPNTDCGGALPLLFVQITVGIFLENMLLGFIFVKFAQPKRRRRTLMFSKVACVTQEDGQICLQVRVGDLRQSHLVDAKVHGALVKSHVTSEGVNYPLYLHDVHFQANGMNDTIMLMWPLILTHKITKESPLWDVKPADLSPEKYELIICIEGTIESTGEFCQARTSYIPSEILWGHRFDRIEEFDSGNGRWEIDFAGFNDVVYHTNIRHSAKELNSFREARQSRSMRTKPPRPEAMSAVLHTIPYDQPPEYPGAGSSTEYQKTGSPKLTLRGLSQTDEMKQSLEDKEETTEENKEKDIEVQSVKDHDLGDGEQVLAETMSDTSESTIKFACDDSDDDFHDVSSSSEKCNDK